MTELTWESEKEKRERKFRTKYY